jgi:hypothetical protein
LLVVPSFVVLPGGAQAQDPGTQIYYTKERQFWIPFDPVPMPHLVKQLQLFVSSDQGKRWDPFAIAPPEQKKFYFTAQADGLYWFAVQTTAHDGKRIPPSMEGARPSLRVIVDTIPPTVNLRPLPPRAGEVGVSWDVRDEWFDENQEGAIRLEYRSAGGAAWTPLRRGLGAQLYWNPETNGVLEVRLRARDRAGNWGEATTNVSLGGQAAGPNPQPPPAEGSPAPANFGLPPLDPGRRMVNSKTIRLNFEIKDKGPSGISSLELWFTQDGRSWNKYPLPKPPEAGFTSPLTVPVAQEGVYGFTLVAKSGVGLGERPPQLGDRPQVWVEVDLTKPVVQLQGVLVGQEKDKGKLFISWTAQDKNLDKTPITLSFAEKTGGPWTPITLDRIGNSGRYVWSMPPTVPYQFLVKVEAIDTAGNVGEALTPELVKVDLSQPKARILTVGPGGR